MSGYYYYDYYYYTATAEVQFFVSQMPFCSATQLTVSNHF